LTSRLSILLRTRNPDDLTSRRDESNYRFHFRARTFQRGRNRAVLNMRVHSTKRGATVRATKANHISWLNSRELISRRREISFNGIE